MDGRSFQDFTAAEPRHRWVRAKSAGAVFAFIPLQPSGRLMGRVQGFGDVYLLRIIWLSRNLDAVVFCPSYVLFVSYYIYDRQCISVVHTSCCAHFRALNASRISFVSIGKAATHFANFTYMTPEDLPESEESQRSPNLSVLFTRFAAIHRDSIDLVDNHATQQKWTAPDTRTVKVARYNSIDLDCYENHLHLKTSSRVQRNGREERTHRHAPGKLGRDILGWRP